MLEFKKLTLEDIEILRPYFMMSHTRACDDTVGGTVMWRDLFDTEYAFHGDNVIFKARGIAGSLAFSHPIGKDVGACLDAICEYCKNVGEMCKFIFVEEGHLERLTEKYRAEVIPEPDWFDYVYNISDLASFSGRKYNGQRNHKNAFLKSKHDVRFTPMTEKNVSEALDFYRASEIYSRRGTRVFEEEKEKTAEVLEHFTEYGMYGGILYANGSVCGFSLGEVKHDTLYVHIEKADGGIRGSYQMLVSEFAKYILSVYGDGVRYINREEDQGQPGLRMSKLSYHPCMMVKKYTVIIK